MKKALTCLLVFLLLASLASCSKDTPDESTQESSVESGEKESTAGTIELNAQNVTEYTIIRPDRSSSNSATVQAALTLKHSLEDGFGVQMPIATDWVDKGKEVPVGTKEILIGKTNRPESEKALEGLGEDEYLITVNSDGTRIVITGTTEEAISLGVAKFMEKFMGYDSASVYNDETETKSLSTISIPDGLSEKGEYRFMIEARKNAIISISPEKYAEAKYEYKNGVYEQNYGEWDVKGCMSSMQVASSYSDIVAVNCDSVMIYSTNEGLVNSWTEHDDIFNIDMMIAINRADLAYCDEHPEQIQTQRSGEKMIHGAKGSYYMVPTKEFIEYIWESVEWSLINFRPNTIAFEEPEMWNTSGFSQGFKDEWKEYFGEEWQDPQSSPEAMLKSMELKTYLFERIISEMSDRIKKIAPETKLYIATHSTPNYNAWGITAGLNHYMATGKVDGVIGQTWSDTIRTAFPYKNKSVVDEYLNAYIDFASYIDSVEGTNFFALADPMSDSSDASEIQNRYAYRQTIAASLMHPQIHRFEICPWVNRAFANVSSTYRTIQTQCYNALNYVGGKAITMQTGTPGIKYAVSDTISWLKSERWSPATSEGLYGVTMPLATAGIPVGIKSMEQIYTADDLNDTKILILSYDNQLPMSETVNEAIADWVKKGGVLLLTSGCNDYWDAADRFWVKDGSPVINLFNKLGISGITINRDVDFQTSDSIAFAGNFSADIATDKIIPRIGRFAFVYEGAENPILTQGGSTIGFEEKVGDGHVIAVSLPTTYYANSKNGCDLLLALTEYATQYAGLEYSTTNLMLTERGRLVIAHALTENDTVKGKFIDIYDENLGIVTDPSIKKKDSLILWDILGYDLSVPRFGFSGGELLKNEDGSYKLTETADEMKFSYTSPLNTRVSTRILVPEGRYPDKVTAYNNGEEVTPITIWNNATSSLLIMIDGCAQGTDVTVTWCDTYMEDGQNVYFKEESVQCNNKNRDEKYLIKNTAGSNDGLRYADLAGELVYKFDISSYNDPNFALSISQNYIVEVSSDGENWILVADYSEGGTVPHIKDGGNSTILNIRPNSYGITNDFYFRIRNSDTTQGWGGTINLITWTYRVSAEEGKTDDTPDDNAATVLPAVDDSKYVVSEENGVKSYKRRVNTNSKNEDKEYLLSNTASVNDSIRFCDQSGELVYYFDLSGTSNFEIVMSIFQNYIVDVSSDNDDWIEVVDYSEGGIKDHLTTGNNKTNLKIKASDYGFTDKMYIKLRNTNTAMGWGGSISNFTISYTRP